MDVIEQQEPVQGRRERKKQATIAQIKDAAFRIIARDGYHAAKIKDIADLADVAERTLFNYATDKRDLLALIFAEDFVQLASNAFPSSDWDEPLCQQIVHQFICHSTYFREKAPVSTVIFEEGGVWYGDSPQLGLLKDARQKFRRNLDALLNYKREQGGLSGDLAITDLTSILVSVFMSDLRSIKSGDRADAAETVRDAARQFKIILTGLASESENDVGNLVT